MGPGDRGPAAADGGRPQRPVRAAGECRAAGKGGGTARPRQMSRSCWPSRGQADGGVCVGGIGWKLGSGMGRIGSGAPGRVRESCSELRRGPECAAAGTEGGAPRGSAYIPGYL